MAVGRDYDIVEMHQVSKRPKEMIRHIKLLRNVGVFDSDSAGATIDLKRLVLIYAENGSGKTTISAILRSLATGDPSPILERHRLGSTEPPYVVLECDGDPTNVVFENETWNRNLRHMKIYDDSFVDENVYSGLSVGSGHRQHLHELILGHEGVELNSRVQSYAAQVDEHNTTLRLKAAAIPDLLREGLSVDEFCVLPSLPNVGEQIESTTRALQAVQNASVVLTAPLFQELSLPTFDIEAINRLLHLDIDGLSAQAESRVSDHLANLHTGGEEWVAQGMRHLSDDRMTCPFCGQDLNTSSLLAHYKAYFSDEYHQLKLQLANAIHELRLTHSDGKQADFELDLRNLRERSQFWSTYVQVPQVDVDTQAVRSCWTTALAAVVKILESKQRTPMDSLEFNEEALQAIEVYEQHRSDLNDINELLTATDNEIEVLQEQTQSASIGDITTRLSLLKATNLRHSDPLSSRCEEYLAEKRARAETEQKRDEAKEALDTYRNAVFPRLQAAVKLHLSRFNAGFTIDDLVARTIRAGTTSTYNIVIRERRVPVASSSDTQDGPRFQNTLSASDRNTLALAFFFSNVYEDPDIEHSIVVVDDPISSLDDHRSVATAQEIRKLSDHSAQVIVLSHSKSFLCSIWDNVDRSECTALQIKRDAISSSISSWNVKLEARNEHDRRHKVLKDYWDHRTGEEHEIARDTRPHLEGYLRTTLPADFPAGESLGRTFIQKCRQRISEGIPILEEPKLEKLREILDYVNQFYHDTNPAWRTQEINSQELHDYVGRTLDFVRPR